MSYKYSNTNLCVSVVKQGWRDSGAPDKVRGLGSKPQKQDVALGGNY